MCVKVSCLLHPARYRVKRTNDAGRPCRVRGPRYIVLRKDFVVICFPFFCPFSLLLLLLLGCFYSPLVHHAVIRCELFARPANRGLGGKILAKLAFWKEKVFTAVRGDLKGLHGSVEVIERLELVATIAELVDGFVQYRDNENPHARVVQRTPVRIRDGRELMNTHAFHVEVASEVFHTPGNQLTAQNSYWETQGPNQIWFLHKKRKAETSAR